MSLNVIRSGTLAAVASLPVGERIGEILTVINIGAASNALVDSSTLQLRDAACTLATNDTLQLVWTGSKWVEISRSVTSNALPESAVLKVSLTPAAEDTNAIDVVGAITDMSGTAVTAAKEVLIRTLAVTDDKGDLAAATVAVGTIKKTVNPATGENVQWMTTTAAGLFSFKVTNDQVEDTLVIVECEGAVVRALKLSFAA